MKFDRQKVLEELGKLASSSKSDDARRKALVDIAQMEGWRAEKAEELKSKNLEERLALVRSIVKPVFDELVRQG